ncbi:MAG: hypothetical protein ACE5K0_03955 [Candidatus Methanofastidiosia archaeon]
MNQALIDYLEDSNFVFTVYKVCQNYRFLPPETSYILDRIPFTAKDYQEFFFGGEISSVYLKTTKGFSTIHQGLIHSAIDIAVFSHKTKYDDAVKTWNTTLEKAEERKKALLKYALSIADEFEMREITGAMLSGSISENRFPAPFADIDFLIFTERNLKHRFSEIFREKKDVKKLIWGEYKISRDKGLILENTDLFRKTGKFALNIITLVPSFWLKILKDASLKVSKEMRQVYLSSLKDGYPIFGDKYILNFYRALSGGK